ILIVYGSNTGNTAYVADIISSAFVKHEVEIINVLSVDINKFEQYDLLIFGTSTWGNGESQKDWKEILKKLNKNVIGGKLIALFCLGDSAMFPEQFASGVRDIYDVVIENGGIVIGYWKNEGYNFNFSRALLGDNFCGLIIDQDNESNLSVPRVVDWVKMLEKEIVNYKSTNS
ncbi:MAG: flavodoxin, partial [Candidatus Hydrogenedens sp.]